MVRRSITYSINTVVIIVCVCNVTDHMFTIPIQSCYTVLDVFIGNKGNSSDIAHMLSMLIIKSVWFWIADLPSHLEFATSLMTFY